MYQDVCSPWLGHPQGYSPPSARLNVRGAENGCWYPDDRPGARRGPTRLASTPRSVPSETAGIPSSGSAIHFATRWRLGVPGRSSRTLSGPIVLVGHSYGGNVISTAAIGNEQVQALVYFNGWMCDVGESQQLLEKFEGSLVGPSIRPVPFTSPDGSEGIDLYLAPEVFHEAFAADVDPETAAVWRRRSGPTPPPRSQPRWSAPPAWQTLPCWYLLGSEDKAIPPALQRFMAERANRRSWRSRLRTSRSCPSPRPRPNSSCRPSRRQPHRAEIARLDRSSG